MKVIAQTDICWSQGRYKPGDTLEIPDDLAERWLKSGAVKKAEEPKPKKAPAVSRSAPRPVTPEE